MIVQFAEPNFLDSYDKISQDQKPKIDKIIPFLIDQVEQSRTIEDLISIPYSNLLFTKVQAMGLAELNMLEALMPKLRQSGGSLTDARFPVGDLFFIEYDEFRIFFSLRGQVFTFLIIALSSAFISTK